MSKPKLICIIGRTCSGKDTLAHILRIYKGIEPLVSYTTRPKRDYEDDGEEHFFITEDDYNREFKDLNKLAYTEINGYRYFTLYDQLSVTDNQIHSYVIDPSGYYKIKEEFSDKIDTKVFYVYCDDEIRKKRYVEREDNISIPFECRDIAEDEQFYEFEQNGLSDCDVIIKTDNLNLLSLIYD